MLTAQVLLKGRSQLDTLAAGVYTVQITAKRSADNKERIMQTAIEVRAVLV